MKLISFSLYGVDPKYLHGALRNSELAHFIYPEWTTIFYVGQGVPESIIRDLRERDSLVIDYREKSADEARGMFWRFDAVQIADVSAVIFRDCDSRISSREAIAVKEWLASEKSLHIIRDHPFHALKILGGMWGIRGESAMSYVGSVLQGHVPATAAYGSDQIFLGEHVYPRFQDDAFVHDEFFKWESVTHRLTERQNYEFVGETISSDEMPDFENRRILRKIIRNPVRRLIHFAGLRRNPSPSNL